MNNLNHLRTLAAIDTDQCTLWDRGRCGDYGTIGGPQRCHRLVCTWTHGNPEPGMHAAHTCGNSLCVNPKHLRWATPQQNIDDKARHGTNVHGEQHHMARLTVRDVHAVRRNRAAGYSLAELARMFGVSKSQVHRIVGHKNWRLA